MATWSAPGKVFLFGEHAVVFGKPGIAMAIKPRVFVTVRKARQANVAKSAYIEECFRLMGVKGSVYVRSQLPSSSGLGSSAAVTVATLSAINDEFKLSYSREQIAKMAHSVEKKVQSRASATDTYVSSFGGIVLIAAGAKRRLPPVDMQLIVGNTMISHNTGRLVAHVADMKEKYPEIIDPILDAMEGVAMRGIHKLEEPKELGMLMNINQSLLDALGVGHPQLSRMILAARDAGAYGAKITGAGGGGSMIAVYNKRHKNKVAQAIEKCDGRPIITSIDSEGVRKEKE